MMRDMVPGVTRKPRGDEHPPREYDVFVDGERAGWAERMPHHEWRFYHTADGDWRRFPKPAAFTAGEQWLADLHRSVKARNTQVTVVGAASVHEVPALDAVTADPFSTDWAANPLG